MWKTQFVGRRLWLWLIYLGVVGALVLIHYRGEIFETSCGSLSWTAKLWHQRLCMAGHRPLRNHYVALVTLTPGPEPMNDYCKGRRFMADLLLRLRDAGPALIVIDKWYLPGFCDDASATAALQQSISQVSETLPVVLAQSSDTYQELRANNSRDVAFWEKAHLSENDQILSESDIAVDGARARMGLARLACNNWQIPLSMQVYAPLHSPQWVRKPEPRLGLALTAAETYDPRVTAVIARHIANRDSLVGAFLDFKQFESFTGTQILCGRQASRYDEAQCKAVPVSDMNLRGRIVLIGQYSNKDTHESVIGSMPGFVLQANYIESLLDDRYYRTLPQWLEILLAILCLVVVDITIERKGHQGALLSLAGVILLWALAHLSIIEWGYYFTFWFPAVVGVAAKWLETSIKMPKKTRAAAAPAGD